MEISVEVGDEVVYTGDTIHAFDDNITLDLMKKHLVEFKKYIVQETGIYNRTLPDKNYYCLKGGGGWCYPCKSFTRDLSVYYEHKYNLK